MTEATMNDSYEVAFSDKCLCCDRLYLRHFKDTETAKDAVNEREACPTCDKAVVDLMRKAKE